MIWGVGAGRCGTKSLALLLDGVHEVFPGFNTMIPEWIQNPTNELEDGICQVLRYRLHEGKPSVDFAQTYVMDLITKVDPEPMFYWVMRNPVTNIESILRLEWWTQTDTWGLYKPAPLGGWKKSDTRLDKAIWHWIFNNRQVMQKIWDEDWHHPIQYYEAKELKVHEHKDPRGKPWALTPEEIEIIVDRTAKTWSQIRLLLDQDGTAL